MITAELSAGQGIGRIAATILAMTQKNAGGVRNAPGAIWMLPARKAIRVVLQFGDKAAAARKKVLVEDGRLKTSS